MFFSSCFPRCYLCSAYFEFFLLSFLLSLLSNNHSTLFSHHIFFSSKVSHIAKYSFGGINENVIAFEIWFICNSSIQRKNGAFSCEYIMYENVSAIETAHAQATTLIILFFSTLQLNSCYFRSLFVFLFLMNSSVRSITLQTRNENCQKRKIRFVPVGPVCSNQMKKDSAMKWRKRNNNDKTSSFFYHHA